MLNLTYGQIRYKVEEDLDLQEETFIQQDEFLGYYNEAVEEAEAEIQTLHDDYFLTSAQLSLTAGQTLVNLPSNIYITKIRDVVYINGSTVYKVVRMRGSREFYNAAIVDSFSISDYYRYIIVNSSAATGPQMQLHPPSRETSSNVMTIWYIRQANRAAVDSDVCDIPEFMNFILQYMKVRCYEKEPGHPNLPKAIDDLERQRELMRSTLADMVEDGDNRIELDLTFYQETV